MVRSLFASVFALAFTMPGCPKNSAPPAPAPVVRGPQVGQPAPALEGVDLEGEPIKLSDYRGKIVVVSFWANWCGCCRALFPHEKELVERYRDQPFVLLGVNADQNPGIAKKVQDRNQLNWRSFFIGDPEGPIPTQWGVKGWPTVFVLDAQGTVRFAFEGAQPQAIERAVESLLFEMRREKTEPNASATAKTDHR